MVLKGWERECGGGDEAADVTALGFWEEREKKIKADRD